jgi:peptidoglycan hydrolase CwlO-like protein
MFTIKKVTAVALATLMFSVPAAVAAETTATPTPINSLTPREQAVIDFQNSLVAYKASVREAMDKHRNEVDQYRTAMTTRQTAIRALADAIALAQSTFKSAVDALGAAPAKPGKPTLPAKPAKPSKADKSGN